MINYNKKKGWSWYEFLILNIPITLLGWIWMYDLQTWDKTIGAWMYQDMTFSGIEPWKGTALADFFFYTVTCLISYAVVVVTIFNHHKVPDYKNRKQIGFLYWIIYFAIFYFFFTLTERNSYITGWLFCIPTLIMFPVVRDYCNIRLMIRLVLILTVFGFVWNFLLVDLGRLVGWDWFSCWWYTFKIDGQWVHSGVYMDKNTWPIFWAWNSPISMVIFMPIGGASFCYTLIVFMRWWNEDLRKINK